MSYLLSKHEIYPDSIIIRTFKDNFIIEDIIDSWIEINKSVDGPKNIVGIINDLRDCKFDINLRKLKKLVSFLNTQPYVKKIKLAVITNSPKTITLPLIIMNKIRGLQLKIFSTYEAADQWIIKDLTAHT